MKRVPFLFQAMPKSGTLQVQIYKGVNVVKCQRRST